MRFVDAKRAYKHKMGSWYGLMILSYAGQPVTPFVLLSTRLIVVVVAGAAGVVAAVVAGVVGVVMLVLSSLSSLAAL